MVVSTDLQRCYNEQPHGNFDHFGNCIHERLDMELLDRSSYSRDHWHHYRLTGLYEIDLPIMDLFIGLCYVLLLSSPYLSPFSFSSRELSLHPKKKKKKKFTP